MSRACHSSWHHNVTYRLDNKAKHKPCIYICFIALRREQNGIGFWGSLSGLGRISSKRGANEGGNCKGMLLNEWCMYSH